MRKLLIVSGFTVIALLFTFTLIIPISSYEYSCTETSNYHLLLGQKEEYELAKRPPALNEGACILDERGNILRLFL